MDPQQIPITGLESVDARQPMGALVGFCYALNAQDRDLMASNWDIEGNCVVDNPLGGIRRGWTDNRATYERLFGSTARVTVEFYGYTVHRSSDEFVAIGRERGRLVKEGLCLDLTIRTTRPFGRRSGTWRQVHHHGSINDPAHLSQYQGAFA